MSEKELNYIISLVDKAIRAAEIELDRFNRAKSDLLPKDSAELTIKNLKKLKENLLNGTITHSKGGTLGLTRNIGEWCHEGELYRLASEIDEYFMKCMV